MLVCEVGTEDAPGNPVLYGMTRGFLEKFGLRSPADLPDLADFAPDEETRRLITERLSATRKDAVVSDEQARTMARALMGEDFEADDGEAILSDEELAQGTDAAAEVLADALEEERGEEAAAIAAGRAKIEDDGDAEAAGGGADVGAARIAVPGAAADALGTADADAMFARAIASTLGVVDKIDFDSLVFETDDE